MGSYSPINLEVNGSNPGEGKVFIHLDETIENWTDWTKEGWRTAKESREEGRKLDPFASVKLSTAIGLQRIRLDPIESITATIMARREKVFE